MNHQFKLKFQRWGAILLVTALLLASCQSEPQPADIVVEPEVVAAETAFPTPLPEPTLLPEPEPEPALITSADDMIGIWLGTVAGERGYVMYTEDGRYTVALVQDNLGTAPRVSGEYWFEDDTIHLRDLINAGHWTVCNTETIGVYKAVVLEGGKVQFQTVEDDCNEGGFTRNYLFATMKQERIGDPVTIEES